MKFFARKYRNLRLVIGARTRVQVEGRLTHASLNPDFPMGLTVQFENGEYDTEDKKIIAALKAHPNYGMYFFSGEPGEAEAPTEAALRAENEKKEKAEEVRSTCPECGKKFKNETLLEVHMKVHDKKE